MSDAVIQLEAICKDFVMGEQTLHALVDVDLTVPRNEYLALTGPSGSGKSTLMNIIGCLDRPTSGEYMLNGVVVGSLVDAQLAAVRNREIGFVFQSFNLLPRATALFNVMQPLIYSGVGLRDRRARAMQALDSVGLSDRLDHLPNQLSGGQRQRVAVARALVTKPAILLADEPTGNLDSQTTREIMALFDSLHADGQTIILITHEPDIAEHCQRIIRLIDGKIAEDTNAQRAA